MKEHFVCFYGSTRIASRNRNQIITFQGIDSNPELVEFGEQCFQKMETGTLYPQKNITIVPFRYMLDEEAIIQLFEDVIAANENYIRAERISFPLMALRSATQLGYSLLGEGFDLPFVQEKERQLRNEWCCYAHYYLHLLKRALYKKDYSAPGVSEHDKIGNIINTTFWKIDGKRIMIHADAGL